MAMSGPDIEHSRTKVLPRGLEERREALWNPVREPLSQGGPFEAGEERRSAHQRPPQDPPGRMQSKLVEREALYMS